MKTAQTSHSQTSTRGKTINSPCSSSRRVCSSKSRIPARPQSGEKCIPSPRGLDHGSPPRSQGGTVVIAPPLPTVPGHGISRRHMQWGVIDGARQTAAPNRSEHDCFTVTLPHTLHVTIVVIVSVSPPTVRPSHPARSSTLKQQGHCQQHPRTLCRIAGDDLHCDAAAHNIMLL